MTDWPLPPTPPLSRQETLWTDRRGSHTYACELRFHGETSGWEAVILKDDWLLISHGGFPLRWQAVQWADVERSSLL